eukprot:Awhi_evm1s4401
MLLEFAKSRLNEETVLFLMVMAEFEDSYCQIPIDKATEIINTFFVPGIETELNVTYKTRKTLKHDFEISLSENNGESVQKLIFEEAIAEITTLVQMNLFNQFITQRKVIQIIDRKMALLAFSRSKSQQRNLSSKQKSVNHSKNGHSENYTAQRLHENFINVDSLKHIMSNPGPIIGSEGKEFDHDLYIRNEETTLRNCNSLSNDIVYSNEYSKNLNNALYSNDDNEVDINLNDTNSNQNVLAENSSPDDEDLAGSRIDRV